MSSKFVILQKKAIRTLSQMSKSIQRAEEVSTEKSASSSLGAKVKAAKFKSAVNLLVQAESATRLANPMIIGLGQFGPWLHKSRTSPAVTKTSHCISKLVHIQNLVPNTILQTDVRPLLQQKIKVKIEFIFTKKEGSWQRREGKT
jgi:hypothetical protein